VLLLCTTIGTIAQEKFTISGAFKDPRYEGKEICIFNGKEKLKAVVKDGKFSFSGMIDQPKYTIIFVNQDSIHKVAAQTGDVSKLIYPASIKFFLEEGNTEILGNGFDDVVVQGTKLNDEYLNFRRMVNKEVAKRKLASTMEVKNLSDSLSLVYIEQNPNTFALVPLILQINSTYFVSNNMDRVEKAFHQLAPSIKERYGKVLFDEIDRIKKFGIGSMAPGFSIKSDTGTDIALTDYKGKYVLIEFWTHSCIPCIKEVPFMKEAFDIYKDKGFSILQISLDKANHHDKWLNAVQMYTSGWDNAIDNEGLNRVANKYFVQGIPDNFLVDPQGKIVAVDLKGDNLKNTLKTLLN